MVHVHRYSTTGTCTGYRYVQYMYTVRYILCPCSRSPCVLCWQVSLCDLFVFGLSVFTQVYFYETNLPTRSEEDWSSVLFKETGRV